MVERIRTLLIKLLGSEKRAIQLESAALLPTFEVLKTEVGTTYLGKIPGRTDHNIRPSYDSSGIAEVDAGQGLAVMVCDGAGPSEGARRLGKRMVATFMAAVHKMKANESFIDHSTE